MMPSNAYRTHNCEELREKNVGEEVKVAGWVETIRDHGGVLFIDLRDHYGEVQIVIYDEKLLDNISRESSVSISGSVSLRDEESINDKITTGKIEIVAKSITLLGKCDVLPFEISSSKDTKEDLRLKYRFLDLRNQKNHENIVLRSKIISYMREIMTGEGFLEIQTPILTSSSPEGARDYIIPSRKHHGKFYSLPQAPQIFKQLLMVSGFDKYFQVAPCFRDEDSRADRSPGEFYQLDFEMAFSTQEDVLTTAENVLYKTFSNFSDYKVSQAPFERITYADSMLKYGTDKPDLRNPLKIIDISDIFEKSSFPAFKGKTVRAINVNDCAKQSKRFFESMLNFAMSIGMKGLGYIKVDDDMNFLGPINKFIPEDMKAKLIEDAELKPGCVLFFISDNNDIVAQLAGQIRQELAVRLNLLEENVYKMCFIVDFPMFEIDDETGAIKFTHNPFSMPQGGIEALNSKDPLEILAYQYDIVCNGVEISSGAVRNHDINSLIKAFEIVGYSKEQFKENFSSLYRAFSYGPPPHAGMAPGIDRIVMMLTEEQNIREVIAFPMNSAAQDLLLGAPSEVTEQQLRETHIKIR